MTETEVPQPAPGILNPMAWAWEAGIAGFAMTTGALMAFGWRRGGIFTSFALIGRRVARDIVLPIWGDAMLGLAIHLGEMFVVGALAAMFAVTLRTVSRVRAAVLAVLVWQAGSMFPPFAVVRPDVVANLAWFLRIGLAVLLTAALVLAPHRSQMR